jgi:hypothetical protein
VIILSITRRGPRPHYWCTALLHRELAELAIVLEGRIVTSSEILVTECRYRCARHPPHAGAPSRAASCSGLHRCPSMALLRIGAVATPRFSSGASLPAPTLASECPSSIYPADVAKPFAEGSSMNSSQLASTQLAGMTGVAQAPLESDWHFRLFST